MTEDFVADMTEPLHEQVASWLLRQVTAGHWAAHQKLPSEVVLAASLGVSRVTLRRAMRDLVRQGLFTQIHGRGTFVAARAPIGRHDDGPAFPTAPADVRLIGVVVPTTTSAFASAVLAHLEHALYDSGYRMLLASSRGNLTLQGQHLHQMANLGAAGIVLFSGGFLHDEAVSALVRRKIPLVLLDRYFPAIQTHVVASDHHGGAYRATEHLLKLGHRRIGYVLANTEMATSTLARLEGAKAALKDYGAPFDEEMVMSAQVRPETVDVFLHHGFRPTAILASNDVRAIELIHVLRQLGRRVPHDIALVGFDDIPLVSRLDPPLTTVAQNVHQLGTAAAHLLVDTIEGRAPTARSLIIPAELVVRQSCGAQLTRNEAIGLETGPPTTKLSILPAGYMS